jgi:hypothetical protein
VEVRTLQALVDLLTPYSLGFLFDCGLRVNRRAVYTVSRIMSGHCTTRSSYLSRFRIVKEAMCVCFNDYKTGDHL